MSLGNASCKSLRQPDELILLAPSVIVSTTLSESVCVGATPTEPAIFSPQRGDRADIVIGALMGYGTA